MVSGSLSSCALGTGTSETTAPRGLPAAPRTSWFVGGFVLLLIARLLAAHFNAFFQNDEISLAAGIAAILKHNPLADAYKYGPQVGYYRLVQLLDLLLGGNVRAVPLIMISLSALAGTVIPACGLQLFSDLLAPRERWLLAGLLAVNPIIWMSSTYGNSTMPATALVVLALTVLSREGGVARDALGLVLFGAGVLVRADGILAAPALALLLWQRNRGMAAVARRIGGLALGLAAIYGVLFAVDARMASTVHDVTSHLTNRFPTLFWDYLLWSLSPFALCFAIVGAAEVLRGRRLLAALLATWAAPVFCFYYADTSIPRYFVPSAVPLSVLAAVGIGALGPLLAPTRARLATAGLAALAVVPLFVGLGWYSPSSWKNLLKESEFETQAGPMWTGAFLYKSYLVPSFLERSVRHPPFGESNYTQRIIDSALAAVARGATRGHTVGVLIGGWNGNAFHYYANAWNARYVSRAPGPTFGALSWLSLDSARLFTIGRWVPQYQALHVLPLAGGDELWVLGWTPSDDSLMRAKVPAGLSLAPVDTTDRVHRYRVTP